MPASRTVVVPIGTWTEISSLAGEAQNCSGAQYVYLVKAPTAPVGMSGIGQHLVPRDSWPFDCISDGEGHSIYALSKVVAATLVLTETN